MAATRAPVMAPWRRVPATMNPEYRIFLEPLMLLVAAPLLARLVELLQEPHAAEARAAG